MASNSNPSGPTHRELMMCTDCFYKLRHDPNEVRPLLGRYPCPRCRKRRSIHVVLKENIFETTYVRDRPACKEWPVKCDPLHKVCGGDQCLYAHGDEELDNWKEMFRTSRSGFTNESHPTLVEKMKPPRPLPPSSNDSQHYASEWPDLEDTNKKSQSTLSSDGAQISSNITASTLLKNNASKPVTGAQNFASIDNNSLQRESKSTTSIKAVSSGVSLGRTPMNVATRECAPTDISNRDTPTDTTSRKSAPKDVSYKNALMDTFSRKNPPDDDTIRNISRDTTSKKSAPRDVSVRNASRDTTSRISTSSDISVRNTPMDTTSRKSAPNDVNIGMDSTSRNSPKDVSKRKNYPPQQHRSTQETARQKGEAPLPGSSSRGALIQSRTKAQEGRGPVRRGEKHNRKSTTASQAIPPKNLESKKYDRRTTEIDDNHFMLAETQSNYMKFSSDLDTFDFSQPLTCETYKEKFHRLLFLEEQEHAEQLAKRCNKEYDIIFCKVRSNRGNFDVYISYINAALSDSDPLAYAKQASISSTICISGNTFKVNHIPDAVVPACLQANFNAIQFYHTSEHRKCLGIQANGEERRFKGQVTFKPEEGYFARLHKAIDNLHEAALRKILPEDKRYQMKCATTSFKVEWPPQLYDEDNEKKRQMELDSEQFNALKKILSSDPGLPLIILGPFGTGKTRLLARSAYNIVCTDKGTCREKVLLVAHHQSSADTLAKHFIELGNPYIRVIRVCKVNENRKINGKGVNCIPVNEIPDGGNFLDRYHVVVTTLGTSSSLLFKVKRHLKVGYFTHILIDEAAQTREPEAIIPLSFAGKETKLVLAGDHCQVGPRLVVLGEKAKKCGLHLSLLERLHRLYSKHRLLSDNYTASLIRNYRCVPEILMLPSNLYYESSLHCEVPNSKDSWYPLQFICSSVKDIDSSSDSSTEEAKIVFNEVKKYVNWHGPCRVCIVSPSSTQCYILRDLLYKSSLADVEVLKTYDVQGREFDAVFISTCEEVNQSQAVNHTRSLSNHYVFNTVITRSKVLVIAVGNPYLLVKTEKDMIKRFPKTAELCWTPYLRKCLCFEQFKISENIVLNTSEDTYRKVIYFFNSLLFEDQSNLFSKFEADDTILKAYMEVYKGEYDSKRASKILAKTKDQEMFADDKDDDNIIYDDTYDCVLNASSFNEAKAIPIDSKNSIVKIIGKKNRVRALNGDTVTVGTFRDFIPDETYGRVIKVVERVSDLTFICEVAQENSDSFFPIDSKNPGFKNFPGYSSVFRIRHGLIQEKSDKRGPVIVYNSLTVNEDGSGTQVPRVADIIDHHRALNMAFVVKFVQWNPKYSSAFGIVIKAYPKGYSYLNAERLLSIIHSVQLENDFEASNFVTTPNTPVCPHSDGGIRNIPFSNAFTIDPEDARNLDDALTLCKLSESDSEQVYQFGVHIVNAAKHVKLNSLEDKIARSKGSAFYYKSYGKTKMIPMLPSNILDGLSLTPGNVRDVWSVTCQVHVNIDGEIIMTNNVQIHPSQLCSVLQLSYENAQGILNGTYSSEAVSKFDDSNEISLKNTIDILYKLSLYFAKHRLKNDAMYWYNSDSDDYISCWQAHKLIAELMIWANNEVAKKSFLDYPSGALLRSQRPPEEKKLDDFKVFVTNISTMSYDFCQYQQGESNLKNFMVSRRILRLIRNKKSAGDAVGIAGILMSDCLFPQLSVASSRKRVISHRSKYCCTDANTPKEEYQHYSLCLETYTHFTSPLRRYADVIVQRSLHHNDDIMNTLSFCKNINECSLKASSFEKHSERVDFSLSLMYNSEVYEACIERNTKRKLIFALLDIKSAQHVGEIRVPSLGPFIPRNSISENVQNMKYCWKIKVSSLTKFSLDNIRGATISKLSSEKVKFTSYFEAYRNVGGEKLEKNRYSIDFKSLCVSIDPKDWKYVLNFTKNPSSDNFKYLDCLDRAQTQCLSSNSCDVHIGTAEYPFMDYVLSLSLEESEVFNIWLNMRKKKCLPEPIVQIVELSPLFRVCVQHNAHPAYCFSDFFLKQASRPNYRNIREYIDLWQSVLLAEAAVSSVSESQVFILRDAELKWPNFTLCPASSECSFSYMVNGPISLEIPKAYIESMSEYFKVKIGDLICARYGYTGDGDQRQIFHFVIRDVQKADGTEELHITMEISKQENKVSKDMKLYLTNHQGALCELQIINMSRSHRRVYEALLKLNSEDYGKQANKLVQLVAVRPNKLQYMLVRTSTTHGIMKTDPLALLLWNKTRGQLNEEQIESVKLAMENRFQLIRGPPGTGKSVTGAHIAYIFGMQNRTLYQGRGDSRMRPFVLYCGPSNKSVDVVFEKFYNFNNIHPDQQITFLRIYGRIVENNDYPALPQGHLSKASNYQCPDWGKPFILHHLIRDGKSTDEAIKEFIVIDKEMNQIRQTSSIPSAQFCSAYRHAQEKAEKSVLKRGYDVVLCTCNEVSGVRLRSVGKPSQCIIDEAGMASEPETIMPINHCEHVVLIGDHNQLQPVIMYRPASDNGLSISLFQRYAKHYNHFMFGLCEQYRMHDAVCEFPSNEFYGGELKTAESVLQRKEKEAKLEGFWPVGPDCPIVFCDVIGEETQEETGTIDGRRVGIESKHNLIEAKKAVEVVQVLCGKKLKIDYRQVAILTPYSAQKVVIQNQLKSSKLKVKVATISESQGDEYGFVILSVVRSKPREYVQHPEYICPDHYWLEENLGFVTNIHQINVAITRSKYGLIIIGNKLLLSYNSTWKNLISHYKERGCVTDESKFPPKL